MLNPHLKEPKEGLGSTEKLLSSFPPVSEDYLDESCPLAAQRRNDNEIDDIFTSFCKRMFMQMDIFILLGNTLSAVFSITAAVSLIPQTRFVIGTICDYGEELGEFVQCPYLPSPVFGACLSVWILYFTTIFLYRYHRSLAFFTNDLRFFLAADKINNEWFILIMVYVGFLFTIVSAGTGLYYAFHNGTETTIGSILVFVFVNIHSLYGMHGGRFPKLKELSLARNFPSLILLNPDHSLLRNPFQPHRTFFDGLISVVMASYAKNSELELQQLGDPQQLKFVTNLLRSE
jgi:hypothetical protein